MAQGMSHLHALNLPHRVLTSATLYVDDALNIKVGNLGLSTVWTREVVAATTGLHVPSRPEGSGPALMPPSQQNGLDVTGDSGAAGSCAAASTSGRAGDGEDSFTAGAGPASSHDGRVAHAAVGASAVGGLPCRGSSGRSSSDVDRGPSAVRCEACVHTNAFVF